VTGAAFTMKPSTMLQHLKATPLRWLARQRRSRGRYDHQTLQLYRLAQQTGDAVALLDYSRFRRDLGHPLPARCVDGLLAHYPSLSASRQWQIAALLREIGHPGLDDQWANETLGLGLSHAAPNQADWRGGFRKTLLAERSRGICVVGNSGALVGSRLGDTIDSAGVVIRFNRFRSDRINAADIGTRTTVWVTAPDYQGPGPKAVDWVVISGPDVCYHMRHWQPFETRLRAARPVITVPLKCWRDMVSVLCAPPSAGVLTLAWLHHLLGGWSDITAVGIGSGLGGGYHHARRVRSSRHAWAKEAALVRSWADQGLNVLPGPSRSPQASLAP
jgi:hypothetical protein